MMIDDLYLFKNLGNSANSEIYLASKKNDFNNYFIKRYLRNEIENTNYVSLLKHEVTLLLKFNHPNILNLVDLKKSKKCLYLIFEFCDGRELSTILDKYQQKYGKPFSEEIIQYLMKQIIEGVKYLHFLDIVHSDLKLKGIFVSFDNEEDKIELNMMKSKIKIGHFKYAGTSEEKDKKIDILDLGKICYKMALGKYSIDSENLEKVMDEIEEGKYNIPINLSKEIILFIKDMVRMDPKVRLKIIDLYMHEFLKKEFKLRNEPKEVKIINQEDNNKNNDELKDESKKKKLCVICLANFNQIIIAPCGHKCICEICYNKLILNNSLNNCPICKIPIKSIVEKVYEI